MIYSIKKTRPSARALERALRRAHYQGKPINFGDRIAGAINSPEAVRLASNKRRALFAMQSAGVPVPELYDSHSDVASAIARGEISAAVGRPDYHRKGRQFYLCHSPNDVVQAARRGATHYLEFIADAREFRVHIVGGQSIKISEKIGGGITKNFEHGARFYYPQDFTHKKTLRKVAKQAVVALGLDFGAVDVLWKGGKFYVLEVNTAPCLTSERSDTLERYVRAIMDFDDPLNPYYDMSPDEIYGDEDE